MAFGRLACWTAESSSMYYQVCHLLDSPWGLWLQDKNPTCDLTGLTTGNYKVLPGKSPGESCPPHTRLGAQPVHLEGVAVKDSGPFWTSHIHMHICIPSLGTSIWRPLYGGGGGFCWDTFQAPPLRPWPRQFFPLFILACFPNWPPQHLAAWSTSVWVPYLLNIRYTFYLIRYKNIPSQPPTKGLWALETRAIYYTWYKFYFFSFHSSKIQIYWEKENG